MGITKHLLGNVFQLRGHTDSLLRGHFALEAVHAQARDYRHSWLLWPKFTDVNWVFWLRVTWVCVLLASLVSLFWCELYATSTIARLLCFVAFCRKLRVYTLLSRWRFSHNTTVMLFRKENNKKTSCLAIILLAKKTRKKLNLKEKKKWKFNGPSKRRFPETTNRLGPWLELFTSFCPWCLTGGSVV